MHGLGVEVGRATQHLLETQRLLLFERPASPAESTSSSRCGKTWISRKYPSLSRTSSRPAPPTQAVEKDGVEVDDVLQLVSQGREDVVLLLAGLTVECIQ